jgi:hypothetical protein
MDIYPTLQRKSDKVHLSHDTYADELATKP